MFVVCAQSKFTDREFEFFSCSKAWQLGTLLHIKAHSACVIMETSFDAETDFAWSDAKYPNKQSYCANRFCLRFFL